MPNVGDVRVRSSDATTQSMKIEVYAGNDEWVEMKNVCGLSLRVDANGAPVIINLEVLPLGGLDIVAQRGELEELPCIFCNNGARR